jgi:TrmH family RNA methyltransferase
VATTLGLHAPAIEQARALLQKRGRRDQGRYTVEGPTMLAEAIGAGLEPLDVFATEQKLSQATELLGRRFGDRLWVVPDRAMARLSDLETPPGIVAVFSIALTGPETMLAAGEPVAVLAGVADPGNAGTLLRTAEIFGIGSALFVGEAVEPHNPKVVRATMGALFRMRVGVCGGAELVAAAAQAGYTIVATARSGQALPDYRFPQRALIAIGNERHGVSVALPHYDEEIAIPHAGLGESLNASVAGGIIFYTFSQQTKRRIFEGQTSEKP